MIPMCGNEPLAIYRPRLFWARAWLFLLFLSVAAVTGAEDLPRAASWKPSSGAPPAHAEGGTIVFPCPFPDGVDRFWWDAPFARNLHSADGCEILYEFDRPEAFRGLTLYFRSGPGWYAAALPVRDGPQRVWLPFGAFSRENLPAGWKNVHGVRLSPWSSGLGAGAVRLREIKPRRADIAIVMPGENAFPDRNERDYARAAGELWLTDLATVGFYPITLEEKELRRLKDLTTSLVVLPLNPAPPPEAVRDLEKYSRSGGKLAVCYSGHGRLAELIGIKPGRWLAADLSGGIPIVRFVHRDWRGPPEVPLTRGYQMIAFDLPGKDGAELMALVVSPDRPDQPHPAIARSNRGLWMSHALGAYEEGARRRMLPHLLEPFLPGSISRAAAREIERARARSKSPQGRAKVDEAEGALARGDTPAVWALLDRAAALELESLAQEAPIPARVPLGIWDHTGKGLYAGNWERTARELKERGFTDVFLFVQRPEPIPAAAVAAASRQGLRVHLWHACFNHDLSNDERALVKGQEERLQLSPAGERAFWLCPTRPENRQSELQRLMRLAQTPNIAGIHLDYIRFPSSQFCYCEACRKSFESSRKSPVGDWPDEVIDGPLRREFLDWRAGQISSFVAEVRSALERSRPGLLLSAAVWPAVDRVGDELGQRWGEWLAAGWVDFVVPMSYTERVGELRAWTRRHTGLQGAEGRIWAGLGVTSAHSRLGAAETLEQIQAALESGAAGIVIFDLNATVQKELFPALRRAGEHPSINKND